MPVPCTPAASMSPSASARPVPARAISISRHCCVRPGNRGRKPCIPGYGFLSQSPEFAQACLDAGIQFVGPSAEAIRLMGVKDQSKSLMRKAGVPVVPGYLGESPGPSHVEPRSRKSGLSAAGQGDRGWRRQGNASGALPGGIRRSAGGRARRSGNVPSATGGSCSSATSSAPGTSKCRSSPIAAATRCTCSSATALCSVAIRRSSKKRRRPTCRLHCAPACTKPRSQPRAP